MNTIIPILFIMTSQQFNLPDGLLSSICYVESGHNVSAYHPNDGQGNSVGICQVKLKTARYLGFKGSEKELMRPEVNIYYAAAYLAHQRSRYRGNLQKAVISYNIGHAGALTKTAYSAKVFKQLEVSR